MESLCIAFESSSQLFLKEALGYHLEEERNKVLQEAVLCLQRHTRGLIQRQKFRSKQRAAVMLQSAVRAWQARSEFTALKHYKMNH